MHQHVMPVSAQQKEKIDRRQNLRPVSNFLTSGLNCCKDRVTPPPWQGGRADVAQPASSTVVLAVVLILRDFFFLNMIIHLWGFSGQKCRCGTQVAMAEHFNRLEGS